MTAEGGVTPAPGPGLAGSVAQGNINPDTGTTLTKRTINILKAPFNQEVALHRHHACRRLLKWDSEPRLVVVYVFFCFRHWKQVKICAEAKTFASFKMNKQLLKG